MAEYGFGRDYLSDGYGGPLLMTIPPLDQYIHNVTFSSIATMPKNYFTILVPNDQYFNQTYLYNGFTLTPTWTTIYYPNGSIAGYGYSTQFGGGVTVSHSNVHGQIAVIVYGFMSHGGYGYIAGMKMTPINSDVYVSEVSFTKEKYYVGEGEEVVIVVLERYLEVSSSVSVRLKILLSQVATAKGKNFLFSSYYFVLLASIAIYDIYIYSYYVTLRVLYHIYKHRAQRHSQKVRLLINVILHKWCHIINIIIS